VTALRNAIYFRDCQRARLILVLAASAVGLLVSWLVVARRSDARSAAAPHQVTSTSRPTALP
jgi:hypothetical protein